MLPFLEQRELFKDYSFEEPWNGPNNSKLASRMPRLFEFAGSPTQPVSTSTNFVAITGNGTAWPPGSGMRQSEIGDGPSNTIQFAEYNGPPIHWMSPVDLEFQTMSFNVGDPSGISSQYLQPAVGMADGAIRRLSDDISPHELRVMCTANGNDSNGPTEHTVEMEDGRKRPLKPGVVSP